MTGGPLYGRILAFDGALVEYEQIYRRADGSERLGTPWRLPIGASSRAPSAAGTSGASRRRPRAKSLGVSRCRWTHGRSGAGQPAPEANAQTNEKPSVALHGQSEGATIYPDSCSALAYAAVAGSYCSPAPLSLDLSLRTGLSTIGQVCHEGRVYAVRGI
jgi:hypothetical protein